MKLETILKICCDSLFVTELQVKSKRKPDSVVMARHLYMVFAKKFANKEVKTLSKIGEFVKRDHSTVTHAVKKFEDLSFCTYEENFYYERVLRNIKKDKSFVYELGAVRDEIRVKLKLIRSTNSEIQELVKQLK